MPAYIVVEIDVHNPTEYEDYKKLTPGSLVNFQGKFIVRGGKTETLEGDWSPKRFVMIEFPTLELAKAWWTSEEYAPAKALRQRTASSKMIVVEGI
jgi:uncharacterized protein (DUF1330 family)